MEPNSDSLSQLHRERIDRARRMSPGQKLIAGPQLFALAVECMKSGIRMENPAADDAQVRTIIRQRIQSMRKKDEAAFDGPVEIVAEILRTLNHLNIPYMLVGALSSNFYGEPRLTKDADFVVQLGTTSLTVLIESLGPDYQVDRQLGFETITATNRYLIEHIQAEFTIELFELTNDPHNQERFKRRRKVDFAGVPAFVATAEDVVIQKLRWYHRGRRPKDIEDAKNVLETQGGKLDMMYIRGWCDQHGTRELLETTLQSIPPLPPV